VFLGLETPENDTLKINKKMQNVNKSIELAVRKLLSYGIVSNGGYIIGFDSESRQIAGNMIDSIQKSGICMAMISLLYALPNTQLSRRLASEGRLLQLASRSIGESDIDQTTSGLNFITHISRAEILKNFVRILEAIYEPSNYYKRVVFTGLNIRPHNRYSPNFMTWLIYMRSFLRVSKKAGFNSVTGFYYWRMVFTIVLRNPKGIEAAVNLAAMFIHFQKQKEYSVSTMNHTIDELGKSGEKAYYARMLGNNQKHN
jgi:radical SAM superfamily enzyme YgiQ (UPF0313 family)